MLNMFRTLIHPSSGACDFSIVSPHWSCVLGSMCVGVSVWLVGVVSVWHVEHRRSEIKLNKLWHQVGFLFFNYHSDARSSMHKYNVHLLDLLLKFKHCFVSVYRLYVNVTWVQTIWNIILSGTGTYNLHCCRWETFATKTLLCATLGTPYVFDSDVWLNYTHGMHCCVSTAKCLCERNTVLTL